MKEFTFKTPTEQESFGFRFKLQPGEVITPGSAVWEVRVLKGVDANPSNLIGGTPLIEQLSDTLWLISCLLVGGLNNVIYVVSCRFATNFNPRIEEYGMLPVREGWTA